MKTRLINQLNTDPSNTSDPAAIRICHPVLMQPLVEQVGFCEVQREFVRQLLRTEIVTAQKPSTVSSRPPFGPGIERPPIPPTI